MTNRDAINILEEVKILDDTMYAYNPSYLEALDMALTALEAEETWYTTHEYPPKTRWISCSERLPEDERRVLILNDDSRYLIGFVKETDWGKEWRYQFDMYDDDVYEEKEQGKIIAWMPLPEPYKEGEQE